MEVLFENEFLSSLKFVGKNADLEFRFSDTNVDMTEKEVGYIRCSKIYAFKFNYNVGNNDIEEEFFWCYIGEVMQHDIENKNSPGFDLAQMTFGLLSNKDIPVDGEFSVLWMDGQITVAVACGIIEVAKGGTN